MDAIHDRLRLVRERFGLTQKDFAKPLNVQPSYYSDLENGRRSISGKFVEKLALAYGVSADWMYTGNGDLNIDKSKLKVYPKNVYPDVGVLYPTPGDTIQNRRFTPYDFYNWLSTKDLDFELSLKYEEFKAAFTDFASLVEAIHKLNAPDFLKEKFKMAPPFKTYYNEGEKVFNEMHKHLSYSERGMKVVRIVHFYESEIDHLRLQLSSLISYIKQYWDFFEPNPEKKALGKR